MQGNTNSEHINKRSFIFHVMSLLLALKLDSSIQKKSKCKAKANFYFSSFLLFRYPEMHLKGAFISADGEFGWPSQSNVICTIIHFHATTCPRLIKGKI